MYDENIRKMANRLKVPPLSFEHPAKAKVVQIITGHEPRSVILTGTAGDGKTHLCRQIWEALGACTDAWQSDTPYLSTALSPSGTTQGSTSTSESPRVLHVIRDLSAWVPLRNDPWPEEKAALLMKFSAALFDSENNGDIFLIAANDGQLTDSWQRLPVRTRDVERTQEVIENLLVEGRQEQPGAALSLFNLSRWSSASLFELAIDAFLRHPGWAACKALESGSEEFFGSACPIRHNFELLQSATVQARMKELLTLCDHCDLHIPVRQILILLSNSILGHPQAKDGLMTVADIAGFIRNGKTSDASLYANVFGTNLPESRRERALIYNAFERFGVGQETSNRVDNLLIFGGADDELKPYFDRYIRQDTFYGATDAFMAAQTEYIEGSDDHGERGTAFLKQLVRQRQGLFFKIGAADVVDMRLWELTVFKFAGEYLDKVVSTLDAGKAVERPVLSRLVRGLNRIFTGRLVSDERELLLATDLAYSQARVSRLLEDKVNVVPRLQERVEVLAIEGAPVLRVTLADGISAELPLHLTRYEFLSRVAEGALPNSFSKECYEDLLAFKGQLLTLLARRRSLGEECPNELSFNLLDVDESGRASVFSFEVPSA